MTLVLVPSVGFGGPPGGAETQQVGIKFELAGDKLKQFLERKDLKLRVWDGTKYSIEVNTVVNIYAVDDKKNENAINSIKEALVDWEKKYTEYGKEGEMGETDGDLGEEMAELIMTGIDIPESGDYVCETSIVREDGQKQRVAVGIFKKNRGVFPGGRLGEAKLPGSALLSYNLANPESQLDRQYRAPGETYGRAGSVNRQAMIKELARDPNIERVHAHAINSRAAESLEKDGFVQIGGDCQ